jgi:glycosyltransferase involved in cell wall biosynthesis
MKVLIVHNQLWAHYKAIIFNELQIIADQNEQFDLLVLQLASVERSRVSLGDSGLFQHQYNYQLLSDGVLEDLTLKQRVIGIFKTLRTYRPDIVNLTGYYDVASWFVLVYCKLMGIKTVLSNESTVGDHARSFLKELFKRLIINRFDGFFNFGKLSKAYMMALGGKESQMLVNRNCVDNELLAEIYSKAFPQRQQRQRELHLPIHNFIFVGRLIEFKNLYRLFEAFKIAQKKSISDWGLVILGEGEQKELLLNYVKDNELKNVCFLEGVNWQQVPVYLSLSDVLVLPSYSEPWGLVVNEAMACGLPVLVSEKCGSAYDLVKSGINGFTFSPLDVAEMSEVLLKFMNNEVDISQMRVASKELIQEYSPKNVAKEMFEGYQQLCHPKK